MLCASEYSNYLKVGRDRIMNEINAEGVPCFSGSCSEVYLENAFDGTPWRPAQSLPTLNSSVKQA
jgi:dTDP-4-amino-4,6-dideoxygalactose transaminase